MPGGQPLFSLLPWGPLCTCHVGDASGAQRLHSHSADSCCCCCCSRAESVGGLEAMGNGKRYQAQARLRPACPDTPHIPHTPHPHIHTPTPPHPHCECSHTGRRVGQQVKHCVQPHQNQLLDGQLVAFTVLQAHEYHNAYDQREGLYLMRSGLWCWPAGLKNCHQSAGPSCHADWPSCT